MRRRFSLIATVATLATLALVTAFTGHPAAQTAPTASNRPAAAKARIGVFDSRVVAIAYYTTPEFQKVMQQMMADLGAAKAANNQAKVDELEFQGPAIQNLMHYQVFSNASIPNVLEKLTAVLPKVAAEAGVSAIVSKWEVAFKGGDADYVDVTDQLVRPFNPSAQTLNTIAQIKTQTPMPLLEAVKTLRPER
jgi:hypothetical protein